MRGERSSYLRADELFPRPSPSIESLSDDLWTLLLHSGIVSETALMEGRRELERRIERGESADLGRILVEQNVLDPGEIRRLRTLSTPERKLSAGSTDLPERIGHHRILREIGAGGAARVYLAEDLQLHRPVAVKILQSTDPLQRARFRRESQVAAALDHPGIVRVYDSGEEGGRAYLVMQYVAGGPLRSERMELQDSVRAVQQVAAALTYAHAKGVVHRDVKPANILRDGSRTLLADFGLGREVEAGGTVSVTGALLGTPSYMSPEQARGERTLVDGRSDIYSLGATLYELSTGRAPFEGRSAFEILEKVTCGEFPSPRSVCPAIPRDLEAVILRAMAFDQERRYPTAQEVFDDLERFLSGERVQASRWRFRDRARGVLRRHPVVTAAVLAAGLAGAAVGLFPTDTDLSRPSSDLWVYRDGLEAGWRDWSWSGGRDHSHSTNVDRGKHALRSWDKDKWGGVQFGMADSLSDAGQYEAVEFRLYAADSGRVFFLRLAEGDKKLPQIRIEPGPPGQWRSVAVPMTLLNPTREPFSSLLLQTTEPGEFLVDEIRLSAGSSRR